MPNKIKKIYLIHHSHSDIGYTDLQERIIDVQIHNLKTVLSIMDNPSHQHFRWTCETYFFVEKFLAQATSQEKSQFFALVKDNKIGMSASYLNFNDLVDETILTTRLAQMQAIFAQEGIHIHTAMNADTNGISMGQRDAMLANGVEFLFTNVHTHHGMFPMYHNQNAFRWQADNGKELLVWNGTHYHDANYFGLVPNPAPAPGTTLADEITNFETHLHNYLAQLEDEGYPHDFIVLGVSGVFVDNAPPNTAILQILDGYNQRHGHRLEMATLADLYAHLQRHLNLADLPVVTGDFTDWWASGIGSTPLAVKHYRNAQRLFHLAEKLAPGTQAKYPDLTQKATDSFLLYAEHTWGHSHSISNPYETFVSDLDIRKTGYASNAHEASALLLNRAVASLGGDFKHFSHAGAVTVAHTGTTAGMLPVSFNIEAPLMDALVTGPDGQPLVTQTAHHLRGILISFTDHFAPGESKTYQYQLLAKPAPKMLEAQSRRYAYIGREGVQDVINPHQPDYCHLHHRLENDWFRLTYQVGDGVTGLYDKKNQRELLLPGLDRLFTPIYENTAIKTNVYEERRLVGRNIRGVHATLHQGVLTDVHILDHGKVHTTIRFTFQLEGTADCFVIVKMHHGLPRIEYKLQLAKHISRDIESIYMPMSISRAGDELYVQKGGPAFRPGVDQIPGTCMEFWVTDVGAAYFDPATCQGVLLHTPDVPLVYMGALKHHPIQLCDGQVENNHRPAYSWVMNNLWETNFRLDLSGYHEYSYGLELATADTPATCFERLGDMHYGAFSYLMG